MPQIAITVPLTGKATVRMRFRADNRTWLHDAIETRRPEWDANEKYWLIPRTAAQRVFDAATAAGRSATITRTYKPKTRMCTGPCQAAAPETVHACTCICGGQNHGQASGGWKQVGGDLLVRSGSGGLIIQTVSNRVGG
jgi:hypothetical protein